jgi:hypothetical protein
VKTARLASRKLQYVLQQALAKAAGVPGFVCQDHSICLRRIKTIHFQIPAANALPGFLFSGITELETVF